MKPKHLICGGLLLIAAALAFTGYNLWEDQRAAQAARQALTAMEAQTAEEGERAPEQPEPSVPEYVLHPDMEMPTVEIDGVEYIGTLTIPALGEHMVYPALEAAAVAEQFGLTGEDITRGVQRFLPTKMRMNIIRRGGDIVILNDAYNANPQSMRAAAAVLGGAPRERRKVAVLGDMLELGSASDMFHRAVGGYFAEAGVDCVIAVGDLARYIAQGAEEGGVKQVFYFDTQEKAHEALSKELRAGTSILVKASRAMAFEKLVQYIVDHTPEETA